MHTVARERALCESWVDAADAANIQPGTARNYPSRYPGWQDLVEYYRREAFERSVDKHLQRGSSEALDELRSAIRETRDHLEDVNDAEHRTAILRLHGYLLDKYLQVSGRAKLQKQTAKLRAQEAVTGEPGDTLTIQTALDDIAEMDAHELADKYREYVTTGPDES